MPTANLLHRARIVTITWNNLALLHFSEDHLRRCKCVFPQSWLIIQMYGHTGCNEYAHTHFIVVLTEHIAYSGKTVRFPIVPAKRIIQSLLPCPLSVSDFWFDLWDGFIPDLHRHMETDIYKLLKTTGRMFPEKSHSNSGKQCTGLCRVVSSPCHCVGYRNTNLPTPTPPDTAG